MDSIQEGESHPLIIRSLLLMSSMMSRQHENQQLPVVLLGRGGGKDKRDACGII